MAPANDKQKTGRRRDKLLEIFSRFRRKNSSDQDCYKANVADATSSAASIPGVTPAVENVSMGSLCSDIGGQPAPNAPKATSSVSTSQLGEVGSDNRSSDIAVLAKLHPQKRSLWEKSLKLLPEGDREALNQVGGGRLLDILTKFKDEAEEKRRLCIEKGFKVKWGEEQIILHDVASKVVMWAERFITIGDIVAQYDPVHAALPWAGFRFLLQA